MNWPKATHHEQNKNTKIAIQEHQYISISNQYRTQYRTQLSYRIKSN